MVTSYVYVFRHQQEPLIKIGSSSSPTKRAKALKEPIDLCRSLQLPVERKDALRIERALQALVREHSAGRDSGDGKTEWFHADALPALVEFTVRCAPLFNLGGFEPLREISDAIATSTDLPMEREDVHDALDALRAAPRSRRGDKRAQLAPFRQQIVELRALDPPVGWDEIAEVLREGGISISRSALSRAFQQRRRRTSAVSTQL